jgi:hypothetical protein
MESVSCRCVFESINLLSRLARQESYLKWKLQLLQFAYNFLSLSNELCGELSAGGNQRDLLSLLAAPVCTGK